MAYGFALARQLRAEVCLLYVHPPAALSDSASLLASAARAMHDQALADLEQLARRCGHDVTTRPLVRSGDASAVIAETSAALEVELIVMGTHARGGLPRAVLGSVSDGVVRRAHCPVLVVPLQLSAVVQRAMVTSRDV